MRLRFLIKTRYIYSLLLLLVIHRWIRPREWLTWTGGERWWTTCIDRARAAKPQSSVVRLWLVELTQITVTLSYRLLSVHTMSHAANTLCIPHCIKYCFVLYARGINGICDHSLADSTLTGSRLDQVRSGPQWIVWCQVSTEWCRI